MGGHLEAGQPLLHVTGELLGGHLGSRAQDDGGADLLAEDGVGHADHRGVGHGGMLEQGGLDLDRVHVLTAADHHVLGPVHDVDEPVLVDPGHVAGVEPSLGEGGGGGIGLVPVAAHDVGPLDPQLAGDVGATREVVGGLVAVEAVGHDRDIAHGDGRADAVGPADVVVAAVHGGHRGRLGEPVAVGGSAHGEVLLDATHEVGWGGRPAVGDGADRRRVARGEARRVDHLHHHGGDAPEGHDPLALDELEGPFGIPVVHHDELVPRRGVRHQDRVAPRGVEQRHRQQIRRRGPPLSSSRGARLAGRAQPGPGVEEEEAHQVGAHVAMGAHRALGLPRRARGVEDGGVVLGVDGRSPGSVTSAAGVPTSSAKETTGTGRVRAERAPRCGPRG